MSSWLVESFAVLVKDARCELRTRVAISAMLLFGLTVLVTVSYAIGPFRFAEADRPLVLSALLWIVVLFSSMASLDRSFVHEEETGTALMLRLAARPTAVWAGKLAFNLLLLLALMVLIVPLYSILMGFRVAAGGLFVAILLVGGYGLAVTTTIVAAMIARAMASGTLFTVLSLPLLLPLLIAVIQGTTAAAAGDPAGAVASLRALVGLGGAMTIVSVWLFPVVWDE